MDTEIVTASDPATIVAQNVTGEMMVAKKIVAAMTEEKDGKSEGKKEEKNAEKKEETAIAVLRNAEEQISLFTEEMMDLTGETVSARNVTDAVKPVAVSQSNVRAIEKGTADVKAVPFCKSCYCWDILVGHNFFPKAVVKLIPFFPKIGKGFQIVVF